MNLIGLIIIIIIISKIMNKAGSIASKVEQFGSTENVWDKVSSQVTMQSYQESQEIRDKMERTKQRILESRGLTGAGNQSVQNSGQVRKYDNRSAMQQVHAGRMEANNTSILERSVKNTDANKEDVTLTTLEAEHKHSERVSAAEHYHPEDVISENMLGTIDDLMIKGYDGELCFERDFLGEAMDMISHFTVPSDVPEF